MVVLVATFGFGNATHECKATRRKTFFPRIAMIHHCSACYRLDDARVKEQVQAERKVIGLSEAHGNCIMLGSVATHGICETEVVARAPHGDLWCR